MAHRPAKTLFLKFTREHQRRKGLVRRNPKEEGGSSTYETLRNGLLIVQLVTAPVAVAVSYNRNQSIGWAFLSGFVSIPYLIYVGISGPKS